MLLSELLDGQKMSGPDVDITGLSRDSRNVQPGHLFAALPGAKADGSSFVTQAIAQGAAAILAADTTDLPRSVTAVRVAEPRKTFAHIAARFYPVQPGMIAAVTGTSGKTSTVQFTRQLWQSSGHKAAAIGTLGIIGDGIERYGSLTTPDCVTLQQDLQMLATEKHISHVAMEASSHGLDQFRLDGAKVKLGAFTNLSREHLDYHETMEKYLAAKLRLFTELVPDGGTAIINRDIPEYDTIAAAVNKRGLKILSFGQKHADIQLTKKEYAAGGQDLSISMLGHAYQTRINLVGAFQSANVMCALAIAVASGEDPAKMIAALPRLEGVRGRMELVGPHKGGAVYVDYAHKPDALENVLHALRPHTEGRLICVFGCGGNRDAGKRPIMGAIAAKLADVVIVTDDNPRFEEAELIRKAVMQGCPQAQEIGDRAEAIAHALDVMSTGDVVVIAGKGHESGQIVGAETKPFDDAEVARSAMRGMAA